MAYTDIDRPDLYFNTKLYTGNGSTQSISGIGFQPDWVWIKARTIDYSHSLFDSVRGVQLRLQTNNTEAEGTDTQSVTAFNSDGFSIGNSSSVNENSNNFVAWNWLASNTTASNTDGSITSTVSANTTSGFSIVSYTGNGTASTIGHGLGTTPSMIIVKKRSVAGSWYVYHQSLGNTKRLVLDTTSASTTDANAWNNTSPTSSVFSVGASGTTNASGATHIGYCFAEKKGFSKAFSYTGNGSTDGSFTYLGFRPAFVIVKRTDSANAWHLFDNKRNTFNPNDKGLFPDTSDAENTGNQIDFLSNGIKFYSGDGGYNGSGGSYIGLAFAESPFVTSTGIPTTAR